MNNPNNPTGSVLPQNMLETIVKIAQKSNAYILCDEVYRGLEHNGIISKSIADIYDKGISTSSMSKVFSLAGLRLGWVAANKDIISEINHQREYNTISVGILDDYFSSVAIENKDKIIKRNLAQLSKGKKILLDWAKNEKMVHLVEPKGGTTAFVRYDLPLKSTELCAKLQNETGVMILPGETMELDGYLRIGYGYNHEKLQQALVLFSDWVQKNL
jgi:aspartate/methionine/tyrosine aminotransferase